MHTDNSKITFGALAPMAACGPWLDLSVNLVICRFMKQNTTINTYKMQ